MTKCLVMLTDDFATYLLDQIKTRNLSQSDLARASGLSRQEISDIINRKRLTPNNETLIAIAHGLKLPPESVLRAAGQLPPLPSQQAIAQEILGYKLNELTPTQLDEVLQFIEFVQDRDEKRSALRSTKQTREGISPPEPLNK
jgi:transcriptional regulator with XRE-family HTH domain